MSWVVTNEPLFGEVGIWGPYSVREEAEMQAYCALALTDTDDGTPIWHASEDYEDSWQLWMIEDDMVPRKSTINVTLLPHLVT